MKSPIILTVFIEIASPVLGATVQSSVHGIPDDIYLRKCKPLNKFSPKYDNIYRVIRRDESLEVGIQSRKPGRTQTSPEQHVLGNEDSGYMSFTTSIAIAAEWSGKNVSGEKNFKPYKVIVVKRPDLIKLGCSFIDLTRGFMRKLYLLKNKSLGDSENSCEVLVFCPRDVSIRRGPPGLPTGPQYVEEDELKVHRG